MNEDMKYGYIVCAQILNEKIDTIIDEVHSEYMRSTDAKEKNRLDAQMRILWHVKSHIEDLLADGQREMHSHVDSGGQLLVRDEVIMSCEIKEIKRQIENAKHDLCDMARRKNMSLMLYGLDTAFEVALDIIMRVGRGKQ